MQPSRFNIITRIKNRDTYLILNALYGNADLLTASEYKQFMQGEVLPGFVDSGYMVNPEDEETAFRLKYIDFLENRDKEEVQVFFVPTYQCNFSCNYCYQSGYDNKARLSDTAITDAFFRFLEYTLAGRNRYITLFGGEPLLTGKSYIKQLAYFMAQASRHQTDLSIVTNGYHLDAYLPMLSDARIREVQLTLDGPEKIHNQRRTLKGNKPTFRKIADNLEKCLALGITVNLRVVLDRENLPFLPELARFAIEKRWTESNHFKTQLGRNYELHYCQKGSSRLFSRIGLYEALYDLIREYPEVLTFHEPAYSLSRFLSKNNSLPDPLFDACPGTKSEWALDYTGKVYSCTATVGKSTEALGEFFPHIKLEKALVSSWQNRDILSIPECRECNLSLACGGGCGSLARNQNGSLLSPDCRPVSELLSMGMDIYF